MDRGVWRSVQTPFSGFVPSVLALVTRALLYLLAVNVSLVRGIGNKSTHCFMQVIGASRSLCSDGKKPKKNGYYRREMHSHWWPKFMQDCIMEEKTFLFSATKCSKTKGYLRLVKLLS